MEYGHTRLQMRTSMCQTFAAFIISLPAPSMPLCIICTICAYSSLMFIQHWVDILVVCSAHALVCIYKCSSSKSSHSLRLLCSPCLSVPLSVCLSVRSSCVCHFSLFYLHTNKNKKEREARTNGSSCDAVVNRRQFPQQAELHSHWPVLLCFSSLRFASPRLSSPPLLSLLLSALCSAFAAAITVAVVVVVVLHATAALNSWRFAAVVVVGVGFAAHVLHW